MITDRPALEKIDITPEMIRAGDRVLRGFDHNADISAEVVMEIYWKMMEARKNRPPSSLP